MGNRAGEQGFKLREGADFPAKLLQVSRGDALNLAT